MISILSSSRLLWSGLLLLIGLVSCARAQVETALSIRGEITPFDSGALDFKAGWTDPGTGPLQGEGWAEYAFEVPATGWYGLYFQNMPTLAREVFIDGKRVSFTLGDSSKTAAELMGMKLESLAATGWAKEANLPLKAGRHVLRLERLGRMGFPQGLPRAWEIRAASAGGEDRLSARLDGPGEVRLGESIKLAVTGGAGTTATDYEIVRINLLDKRIQSVARVRFEPGADFVTKTVAVPMPEEGVFEFHAKAGERLLDAREFPDVTCYVVETRRQPAAPGADARLRTVAMIDCVNNTLNGRPVVPGENYWEANGASRISRSAAGVYRESGDGRGPEAGPHPKAPAENFPGFAYRVDVPEPGRPYLIEIDHPDDDWRSVCVPIADLVDVEKKKGVLPPAYAFETGGNLALTNRMLTQRILFWPNGRQIHFGLVSSRPGKRAAAAAIRVSLVEGALPTQTRSSAGRIVGLWMEEPMRWHTHFNTPPDAPLPVRDWIGLNRTMEWIAYRGMNAFWPVAAAYQNATYDSAELKGYIMKAANLPRLSALLCEKYGLAYVPEIFFAGQRYFDRETISAGAEHPADLYTRAWWGFSRADDPAAPGLMPSWNILHPQVQDKMIAIYGELADTLGDSPAFIGMSGRIDCWQWNGYMALTSLNWGYEDWTIARFSHDTGVTVPGAADDPERFEKRYRFLTSPEMKARWVGWRCARVTDFYQRLAQRIRRARPGATMFLCGSGDSDETHKPGLPSDIRQRLAEMGVDFDRLARDPSIAILPTAFYGRGKTFTYLADQRAYDDFSDPANINAGFNATRGLSAYGSYQEWAAEFPLGKLGVPLARWWYCSGSDAAGDNLLERMSVTLADQDTMVVRDGGYPLLHGRDAAYSRWMAEFSALPRAPFVPVPSARDPVAVWQRDEADGLLFYAVNRDRHPARITFGLQLTGSSRLTRPGTGKTLPPATDGTLTFALDPFELRVFRAPPGSRILTTRTDAAPETIAFVRERLAYAQELAQAIRSGVWKDSFSASDQTAFGKRLDLAWTAARDGAWWRARTVLGSAPMMTVYEKTGHLPAGQVETRFPNQLEALRGDRFDPDDAFNDATALLALRAPGGDAALTASESFNPDWPFVEVVASAAGVLEFDLPVPAPGRYTLSVGHVGAEPGVATATLAGRSLAVPLATTAPGQPDKTVFPSVDLPAGKVRLTIRRPGRFGLYALKLVPVLRPLDTTVWSTTGPFPSEWSSNLRFDNGDSDRVIKTEMELRYPPEINPALTATYTDAYGRQTGWRQTDRLVGWHEETGVNFAPRAGISSRQLGFAQTFITSPEERDALVYLGSDWWTNAWLNGDLLKPLSKVGDPEKTGAWFTQWKPRPALVHLKKGVNRLLVKTHGGNAQCWFIACITDTGDLRIAPKPE